MACLTGEMPCSLDTEPFPTPDVEQAFKAPTGGCAAAGVNQEGLPSDRQQAEAFLAALIFAVHPIHTEAVAGIVGQAELISAGLSILALLTYFRACLPG